MNSKTEGMVTSHLDNEYEMEEKSPMAGTDTDRHDMQMLGKAQQLNVRAPTDRMHHGADTCSETFASSPSSDFRVRR